MGVTAGNIYSGVNPCASQMGEMQTQSPPHCSRCEKSEYYTEYSTNCEPGTCIPEKELYDLSINSLKLTNLIGIAILFVLTVDTIQVRYHDAVFSGSAYACRKGAGRLL